MLLRRVVVGFASLLIFAPLAHAQSDFSGTWSGTISFSATCPGGGSATQTLNLLIDLQQSGSSLSGSGTVSLKHDPCVAGSPTDQGPGSLSGTVSGSNASGTVSGPFGSSVFTATLTSSSSMTFSVQTGGARATGTLTKALPPAGDFSGSWSGTFNANDSCGSGSVPEHAIQWSC